MADRSFNKRKKGARNARILGFLSACICVCLAFSIGFFIRGDQAILAALGFESLIETSDEMGIESEGATVNNSLSARVSEAENMISKESLEDIDLETATKEVLTAFAESSSDKYVRYYDANRYAAFVQENTSKYAGIGVLFSESDGHAFVTDVFPGSAAESADVRVGDYVVAIDADKSQDWSQAEVVNAVSRDEGESVVITWRRAETYTSTDAKEFTTTLTCSNYTEKNVVSELIDDVGYIQIKQFTQNSASLVEKALKSLTKQGAKCFVLDIRDNPGGYLTQAVEVASLFIKSGTIVNIESAEAHNTTKIASGTTITDEPVVMIINKNTSAAAEVLVAALKDNGRATVVGATTMGKGSVQVVRALSFGGAFRYTAAYYKTPLGNDIQGVGVSPDIRVDKSTSEEGDNQKELALETAHSLVESTE